MRERSQRVIEMMASADGSVYCEGGAGNAESPMGISRFVFSEVTDVSGGSHVI